MSQLVTPGKVRSQWQKLRWKDLNIAEARVVALKALKSFQKNSNLSRLDVEIICAEIMGIQGTEQTAKELKYLSWWWKNKGKRFKNQDGKAYPHIKLIMANSFIRMFEIRNLSKNQCRTFINRLLARGLA